MKEQFSPFFEELEKANGWHQGRHWRESPLGLKFIAGKGTNQYVVKFTLFKKKLNGLIEESKNATIVLADDESRVKSIMKKNFKNVKVDKIDKLTYKLKRRKL